MTRCADPTRPAPRTVTPPTSAEQCLAAQRIINTLPRHDLTMGEALAVLAVALESVGVLDQPRTPGRPASAG